MNYGPVQGGAGGPTVFDPHTLPSDDNVNSYTFCVELKEVSGSCRRAR